MLQLIQGIVDGLAVASIIALSAVGLTLTYGILKFANFAHGDFLTLGAYLTLWGNQGLGLPLILAIPLSCLLTVVSVLTIDRLLWEPLRKQKAVPTTVMVASIGLSLVLRNLIILAWGSGTQEYNLPIYPAISIFGLLITQNRLLAIGIAMIVIGAVYYGLQNTKVGWAMRAVADNPELAKVTGINVNNVTTSTWIVAGALTALGGSIFAMITNLHPNLGWFLIIPLFASVILGGIGNPYGAIWGAVLIGVTQEVGTLCGIGLPFCIDTQYKLAVGLGIMILVLLCKPQGLFKA